MSLLSGGGPTGVSLAGLPPEMIMKLGEMGQQGDYQRMKISQLLGQSLENKQAREDALSAAQTAQQNELRKIGQKDTELQQGADKIAIDKAKLDNEKAMLYYDQEYKSALASNNYSAAGEAQRRMKEMDVMNRALEAFENGTATEAQKALVDGQYLHKGKGRGGAGTGGSGDDDVPEAQVTARRKAAAVAAQEAIKSSSNQATFNVHNKVVLDWAPDDTRKLYKWVPGKLYGGDVKEWELPSGVTLGTVRQDAKNLGITTEQALDYIYNKYVKK